MSSRRLRLKQTVTDLLREESLTEVIDQLAAFPPREVVNPLFSCLCHPEEIVRWHAVSGFGLVVPAMARADVEQARMVMRRFLWMLNDESGGIGWGVPEAMAEVMVGSAQLAREFLHLLVSYTVEDGPELFQDGNFLENEALQEGVLWGLCRVAPHYPGHLLDCGLAVNLDCYFAASRSTIRGLVCRLCGLLELASYRPKLLALRHDRGVVRVYQDGVFAQYRVGELAETACRNL